VRKDSWILGLLIIILGFFVFLRPYYAWEFRNAFFSPAPPPADLAFENKYLRAELAKLNSVKSALGEPSPDLIPALVFSRYPMNFKEEILVGAGRNNGVSGGETVLYNKMLVGKVIKVFGDTSLVETIFDSRFQLAVRVGNGAVDALLSGGAEPQVTLIPGKSKVVSGDIVYSAAAGSPYGLPIGDLGVIKSSADRLFIEAGLNLPYDLNEIKLVSIVKNAAPSD